MVSAPEPGLALNARNNVTRRRVALSMDVATCVQVIPAPVTVGALLLATFALPTASRINLLAVGEIDAVVNDVAAVAKPLAIKRDAAIAIIIYR